MYWAKESISKSRHALDNIYVTMRHLFNRGFYKPNGMSGQILKDGLLELNPEIYGEMKNPKRVEFKGLDYVLNRLPKGIEECRYIHLIADEGYSQSNFELIKPEKRRRNCYRVDQDQMHIEITRGRSDVYDFLTHITFFFNESSKIAKQALNYEQTSTNHIWKRLEKHILNTENESCLCSDDLIINHLSLLIGHTFSETKALANSFCDRENDYSRFLKLIYWMGKIQIDGILKNNKVEISFSNTLRENIGHHIYGEKWALKIKNTLKVNQLEQRPLHIVSANMHSVMNTLFAREALKNEVSKEISDEDLFSKIGLSKSDKYRKLVFDYAIKKGMIFIEDNSGSNVDVQIFDMEKLMPKQKKPLPVMIVMDYAFGEQAYELMDELLKPFHLQTHSELMNIESISIMGKAGILEGDKGDIMIPQSHIFEGSAGNYPFKNDITKNDFKNYKNKVFEGNMVTVLGTSLQNKEILSFFKNSTWNAIGLDMEGANYQKAIQAASLIRKSISKDVVLRYVYYASDNPLHSGSTLASGELGEAGIKPTYFSTKVILDKILS